MSFIRQAAKIFDGMPEFKFQVVLFGRDALYIEGAKPIKIDCGEMIFRTGKCVITVTGDRMEVKDLVDDCISIVGKISGFSVSDI